MIRYRSFLNSDPPHLAELWRSVAPQRGMAQPMTTGMLETAVLAKPYFDRDGLILAVDEQNDEPVGFAHAGFGPCEKEATVSTQLGTTLIVVVRPEQRRHGIGSELLNHSEAYLRRRGAQVLYAGGIRPLNAFYLGLYGGSELPGILASSPGAHELFVSHGYREIDRTIILHRELADFRPVMDRCQMQIRRSCRVDMLPDPKCRTWWEACTYGAFDRVTFALQTADKPDPLATCTFWTLQSLAGGWGVTAFGLIDVEVANDERRRGLATFLLGEAFRVLHSQGVGLVEVQTMIHNSAALKLYKKLGFCEVDQGVVYRKEEPA